MCIVKPSVGVHFRTVCAALSAIVVLVCVCMCVLQLWSCLVCMFMVGSRFFKM